MRFIWSEFFREDYAIPKINLREDFISNDLDLKEKGLNMKKLLLYCFIIGIVISMIATFSLVGCKATAETATETTTVAETTVAATTVAETTTEKERTDFGPVVFWIQDSSAGNTVALEKYLDELISKFYDKTKIKVTYNIIPWGEALAKHDLASTGGEAPDVMHEFYLGTRVIQGEGKYGPIPLNDYIIEKFGSIDAFKEIFSAGVVDSVDVSPFGEIMGVPVAGDAQLMVIRDDLFKEAGIIDAEGNAKAPTTYSELLEDAKKLTIDKDNDGKIDQYGIAIGGSIGQGFWRASEWPIFHCGLNVVTDDFKKSALDDPLLIESFQFVRDLLTVHKVVSPSIGSPDYAGQEDLGQGLAAIQLTGSVEQTAYFQENFPNAILSGHVQPKGFKTNWAQSWVQTYCIYRQSEHTEAALEWLWFITEPENEKVLAELFNNPFMDKEVFEWQLSTKNDPLWAGLKEQYEAGIISQDLPMKEWPKISGWEEGDPLHDLIYNLWDPKSGSIEEILKKANDQINEILTEGAK